MAKMVLNPNIWQKLQKSELAYTINQARSDKNSIVVIPNHINFICDNVFRGNTNLKSVIFSQKCFVIGASAFEDCSLEKNISFPNSLQVIRKRAFYHNTKLRSVEIPKFVKLIELKAFKECYKLNTVKFHKDCLCKEIQEEVFYNCSSLQTLILPSSLEKIDKRAFYRCKMLEDVRFPTTVKYIGSEAFYFSNIKKLELPIGIIEIGDSAFFKCNQLTEVKIPATVRRLGKWVFHGCNRLKLVEILHEPEFIGEWIINKSAKIRCRKNSSVDEYCEKYGFDREYI